ncbi:hypothetical protein ATE92_2143 [Ulvibacter sp. MAR_2010_11]|uniref:DUF6495 family protein n=1 Tax=Ulvibacter sp. MAR_2010_11 TaxID=1250229 RepID=UPI000C2C5DD7|nr:DUF6495 family protein [Ulvibacter sp. MAR_2010_11]PKA83974.1 hypothetical protein ATE92_2143 [Ulvibacter sp. MAR_2010_11]
MKYTRLTKEQLHELHPEFINFLATQSITAEEWAQLKTDKPEVAEEELDVFSDLVWEGVLSKANYLENISARQLFLFCLKEKDMQLIVVKVLDASKDITTAEDYKWLQENYGSDSVEFLTATKVYSEDRYGDVFNLIQQGAVITKGELFNFFDALLSS